MENLTNREKGHVQVARKIKEMGLKQGDILVYTVIKDYKNQKTGLCNPGLDKEIVPRTGLSKNFVLGAINRLEEKGLITIHRQRGTSNKYTFKEIGEEFDRFAKTFLDIKDLTPNTKDRTILCGMSLCKTQIGLFFVLPSSFLIVTSSSLRLGSFL